MTIKVGDKLPEATFMIMGASGPAKTTAAEVFKGKKVALFAVPGAFTPTCQQQHVPGFVARVDELKRKGVDTIACTAVNDVFVLEEFAKATGAKGKILMLADGNGEFAKKLGLDIDLSGFGLGLRSKRSSGRARSSCTPTASTCSRVSRPGSNRGRRTAGAPPTRSR